MERSGNPGTRVARHSLALWLWAPDQIRGDTIDDYVVYRGMPFDHEAVRHVDGEYVRGDAHTNGIESSWSMLKRAHKGTFHKISPKHMQRYVNEFAGRHNDRSADTVDQITRMARGMVGKRLRYRELVAD